MLKVLVLFLACKRDLPFELSVTYLIAHHADNTWFVNFSNYISFVNLSIFFSTFLQTAQITLDNNVVQAAVFEFYLQLILTGKCLNALANRLCAFSDSIHELHFGMALK